MSRRISYRRMPQISSSFLEVIMNLLRLQNEQLLDIIVNQENVDKEKLVKLKLSAYDCKNMMSSFTPVDK